MQEHRSDRAQTQTRMLTLKTQKSLTALSSEAVLRE
jgi:hypothetical protein